MTGPRDPATTPDLDALEGMALECVRLLRDGIEAFRLTREYVGEGLLPPVEGWSWFDWCQRAETYLAAARREPPAGSDREQAVVNLAAHLHRKGVGCDAHLGDGRAVADETHKDDAYDIYDHVVGEAAIRGREGLDVERSAACPLDPKCYRYQGHDGPHMYAGPYLAAEPRS